MRLDNVLAIGALAAGLLLSIALLLFGSTLIAELIGRLPWLLGVAALVLAWTAAMMILDDIRLGPVLEHFPWTQFALPAVAFAIVIAALTSCELPEAVYAQDLNIHRLRIIEFERRACKLVHQGCNFLHAACGTRQSIKGLKAA
jgi:hypothetical protein